MKKLGKLSISPEKIMKNEDLINLQGGYDGEGACGSQPSGWCSSIECIKSDLTWGACEQRLTLNGYVCECK